MAEMKRVVHASEGEKHSFDWGSITWLHSGAFSGSEELTVGEVVIRAGCSNPMHIHANCEEALYRGDEPDYRLKPGSAIVVPRGVRHNARCISDRDARMIVAYSSPAREMQGE